MLKGTILGMNLVVKTYFIYAICVGINMQVLAFVSVFSACLKCISGILDLHELSLINVS